MHLRQVQALACWLLLILATNVVAQAELVRDRRMNGAWRGEVVVGGDTVPLAMRIFDGLKGHRGRIAVGAAALPGYVLKAEVIGSRLLLDLGPQGSYIGIYEAGRQALVGHWRPSQGAGAALPLVFRRAPELGDEELPQQGPGPYPYDEVEVELPSSEPGRKLFGTLTRPKTPGPHPAIVLHTGCGGFDRDETLGDRRAFFAIADILTRRGMAVIRYDKIGTGKSPGTFIGVSPAQFAADYQAIAAWARTQPEIDPARVGYIGHSEGGMIAVLAAGQDPKTAFVVAIAPPLQNGEAQAVDMLSSAGKGFGASGVLRIVQGVFISHIATILREEQDDAKAAARMGFIPELYRPQLASPWARFYLSHDGRASARRVTCPAYVVFMKDDPLVPEKLNSIAAEEGFAGPNRARVRIEIRTDVDHFLAPTERPKARILPIVWTVAPTFMDAVVAWLTPTAGLPQLGSTDSRPR